MSYVSKFRSRIRSEKAEKNEHRECALRKFAAPSPSDVKRAVPFRYGSSGAVLIETGTFIGDTAALLAQEAFRIYTIELEETLFARAREMFKKNPRVVAVHGLSDAVLPSLLPTLSGRVNFWLDGHCSGGGGHASGSD